MCGSQQRGGHVGALHLVSHDGRSLGKRRHGLCLGCSVLRGRIRSDHTLGASLAVHRGELVAQQRDLGRLQRNLNILLRGLGLGSMHGEPSPLKLISHGRALRGAALCSVACGVALHLRRAKALLQLLQLHLCIEQQGECSLRRLCSGRPALCCDGGGRGETRYLGMHHAQLLAQIRTRGLRCGACIGIRDGSAAGRSKLHLKRRHLCVALDQGRDAGPL